MAALTPDGTGCRLVNNSRESYRFPFDGVLPPEAAQDAVYDAVAAPVLAAALDGYSSTVFAYGQTGSGKTYTISGGTERYADRGLIPRALAALFREIAARGHACTYTVHLSYLEIYNEVWWGAAQRGGTTAAAVCGGWRNGGGWRQSNVCHPAALHPHLI